MDFILTTDQVISWSLQLSSQHDFQALTHKLLEILNLLPGIDEAVAYEVYYHEKIRTGEAGSPQDQLISRFPIDFTKEANEKFHAVLADYIHAKDLTLSPLNSDNQYSWAIFSVSNGIGPDRAIVLEGKIAQSCVELITNLRRLYNNLVFLHDTKERDVLTRLLNRQSLDTRLLQVCQHYRANPVIDKMTDQSSWIAVMDIDFFKRINDSFGHLYGDEVLLIFSQIMSKNFRYNDFLFRFGGEEFVVILNLAAQELAEATFNRFRLAIANYDFPTVGKVTVSIGVTHVDSTSIPSTLLDRADKALYQAKNSGRNKVILYEDMMDQPNPNPSSNIELF
jgi:diguanylate cyclase (GGDEF)-like protein